MRLIRRCGWGCQVGRVEVKVDTMGEHELCNRQLSRRTNNELRTDNLFTQSVVNSFGAFVDQRVVVSSGHLLVWSSHGTHECC